MYSSRLLLISFASLAVAQMPSYGCPPDGPLLPKPTALAGSSSIDHATKALRKVLDSAIAGDVDAGFAVENTSFSLSLVAFDDPDPSIPTWQYHHRAEGNTVGVNFVDGETQYLVGSISKLFSDLLLLKTGINLDDPITKHLPVLNSSGSVIDWNSITLASLADHLSGIPPNYGFSEFYILKDIFLLLGFPVLAESDYGSCGITGLNGPCTREDVLKAMLEIKPVVNPYDRPLYSQLSFQLLAYVMNATLGKNYAELLDELVITPLNLTNTGVSPGNDSRAVVPPLDNSWGADYGDNAPGGGLYSSLNDLSKLVHSILNYKVLDTPAEVKAWLKPHSSTSSPYTLVGRPWEIYRSTNLTPAHPHTIDLYMKDGGAYGYVSRMAVVDQYGIGLVVLTAGDPAAQRILFDLLLSEVMPAIEEETRAQADAAYVGTWTSEVEAAVEMNITIDDGHGLKLESVTRNGSNILAAYGEFFTQALPQFGALDTDFRIYPTSVVENTAMNTTGGKVEMLREDWRINLNFLSNTAETSGSELPGQGAMQDYCSAWQTADWVWYGGEGLDRIVFVRNVESGKLMGVEFPALRSGLLMKT